MTAGSAVPDGEELATTDELVRARCLDGAEQPARDGCAETLDRLYEYLDSELDAPDADRVRDHLAGCASCWDEFDLDSVLKSVVRRGCREEAPGELRARVEAQFMMLRARTSWTDPSQI